MESKAREKTVDLIREWISSKKPTRVIIIAQRTDVEPWFRPNDRKFLEVANSDYNFPLIHSTATISGRPNLCSAKPMSIVLALNKESMLFDPIHWPALIEWAAKQCPDLVVSSATDKLFRERVIPGHRARVSYQEIPKPTGVYSFFSPHSSKGLELKHLVQIGVPVDLAKLINRTNLHEKGLTMLGILPRQFRTILRASIDKVKKAEEAWNDISKALFWQGYELWSKRKNMMKEFWKNVAPEEWKTHKKRKDKRNEKKNGKSQTKEKKRRKRKRKDKNETSQCVDPFHFIQKCDNLSKERPTKCLCSRFNSPKKSTKSKNIKSFLTTIPILCPMSANDMDFILVNQN